MTESFSFPDQTVRVMQSLQKTFGVKSNAEVISRALSLAQIVADKADPHNIVALSSARTSR